ncbi:MAG: FadR family transcriptional regulator [Parafilimonas terrae]|nr:FadR family transcriptional regulator [Parafilimonas terrae]
MQDDVSSVRSGERRRYQQVADAIRALIQQKRFGSGDRLPAERELASQLGVSRPSLREALIALEIEGTIEIRMGSGLYVLSAADVKPARAVATGDSPVELMQARAVVEGAVILLAAARMTQETADTLRGVLDSMRISISQGQKPLDQDRRFHTTIAAQSGNGVLTHLVGQLFDERHSPMSAEFRNRFETADSWRLALDEHEAILAALQSGDPLLAQALMHAHLDQSKRRWLESDAR